MIKRILTSALFAIISISSTYGQAWYEVPSGVTSKLNTIEFASELIGYIGGDEGVLLKTIDGGKTWSMLSYTGVSFIGDENDIVNLNFGNETVGYMTVGPYSNGYYKTVDGGESWVDMTIEFEPSCYYDAMYFFEEDYGFVGASGCFSGEQIYIVDGIDVEEASISGLEFGVAIVVAIDFLNENFGMAVSGIIGDGQILRTTDGGESWTAIETDWGSGVNYTGVTIVNSELAYVTFTVDGGANAIMRTDDGGLTWSYDPESFRFNLSLFHNIHQTESNRLFFSAEESSGEMNQIFSQIDSEFWNSNFVDQRIFDFSSYSDTIVWGVGDNGYIVVNTPPELLELNDNDNVSFEIYPNPVGDLLSIDIMNHNIESILTYTIFNLDGKLVKTQEMVSKSIDVSDVSPGMYILSLRFEDREIIRKFNKN